MRTGGVLPEAAPLYGFVLARQFGASHQIVAKRQVSPDRCRTLLVAVQMNAALAGRGIIEGAEPSAGETVFAPPLVPEGFHLRPSIIKRVKRSNHRDDVQYGLCDDPGYGRRPDVMDGQQLSAKGSGKPFGFRRDRPCPKPIMRLQLHCNGGRH